MNLSLHNVNMDTMTFSIPLNLETINKGILNITTRAFKILIQTMSNLATSTNFLEINFHCNKNA